MSNSEYVCQGCDGDGEMECYHCGSTTTCDECHGTGLDDTKLNVAAFREKNLALMKKHKLSVAWIENGVCLGRMYGGGVEHLAYKDFAREAAP